MYHFPHLTIFISLRDFIIGIWEFDSSCGAKSPLVIIVFVFIVVISISLRYVLLLFDITSEKRLFLFWSIFFRGMSISCGSIKMCSVLIDYMSCDIFPQLCLFRLSICCVVWFGLSKSDNSPSLNMALDLLRLFCFGWFSMKFVFPQFSAYWVRNVLNSFCPHIWGDLDSLMWRNKLSISSFAVASCPHSALNSSLVDVYQPENAVPKVQIGSRFQNMAHRLSLYALHSQNSFRYICFMHWVERYLKLHSQSKYVVVIFLDAE